MPVLVKCFEKVKLIVIQNEYHNEIKNQIYNNKASPNMYNLNIFTIILKNQFQAVFCK